MNKVSSFTTKPLTSSMKLFAVVAALATAAAVNQYLSNKAERENPPRGKFIDIDGVRLHYVERGVGPTLVLLHGNGSMIQDFESSGLIERASKMYRVIAFDRPGFGHSSRPRTTIWTPNAQARLLRKALLALGVSNCLVLGHSWGASVAVAMGLAFPEAVDKLVLASGYYYPSPRLDVVLLSGPAIPIAGDILAQTISPIAGRLMWPMAMRKIFGPADVPAKFTEFPKGLALRPSQIRASAAESALMVPDAMAYAPEYSGLKMPVMIVAGEDDRLIDINEQSARLHLEIPNSQFRRIPSNGHMIHQTATDEILAAIDDIASTPAT